MDSNGRRLDKDEAMVLNEHWWSQCTKPTFDTMLGGTFDETHRPDITESLAFIEKWIGDTRSCLELGCGVGRVTTQLLAPVFDLVVGVDAQPSFIEIAERNNHDTANVSYQCSAIQRYTPTRMYDVCWIQWVLNYLTDQQLVSMLNTMSTHCSHIIIKENVAEGHLFVYDRDDHSVTRTHGQFESLFAKASLKITACEKQQEFPDDMFDVFTWLLTTK